MNYLINLSLAGKTKYNKSHAGLAKRSLLPLDFLCIPNLLNASKMYGLYDKEGILRYVNSDKDACIAYAELFDLNAQSYLLMSLNDSFDDLGDINFDQNPAKNSN